MDRKMSRRDECSRFVVESSRRYNNTTVILCRVVETRNRESRVQGESHVQQLTIRRRYRVRMTWGSWIGDAPTSPQWPLFCFVWTAGQGDQKAMWIQVTKAFGGAQPEGKGILIYKRGGEKAEKGTARVQQW